MLETLFWIAVGALVGWNFPQPKFAKRFQEKYLQSTISKLQTILFFWK